MNPIEEKDLEIAELKKALESSKKESKDIASVKNSLIKTKNELQVAKRAISVSKNKIDFAKEQRMDFCLSDSKLGGEVEKEQVNLYSTLVDEDNFELSDDNKCSSKSGFLADVERQIMERGGKPNEKESFENVKIKILEAVKKRKSERKSRIDSIGRRDSIGSPSSVKRNYIEAKGNDISWAKIETK